VHYLSNPNPISNHKSNIRPLLVISFPPIPYLFQRFPMVCFLFLRRVYPKENPTDSPTTLSRCSQEINVLFNGLCFLADATLISFPFRTSYLNAPFQFHSFRISISTPHCRQFIHSIALHYANYHFVSLRLSARSVPFHSFTARNFRHPFQRYLSPSCDEFTPKENKNSLS